MDDEELAQGLITILQNWAGWDGLNRILTRYPNCQLCAVGGSVRDVLLNRSLLSKDFDFIIYGTDSCQAVQDLAEFGQLTFGQFGSPRWFPKGTSVYADIMNAKDWKGIRQCEDVIDCLNEFDFSANAIACDLRNGRIYDPQNGRRDISRRQIRAIRFDFPDGPISSTLPLSQLTMLWFRLLHYAHKLNMSIEVVTMQWLIRHRHYLSWKAEFSSHFFVPRLDRLDQIHLNDACANQAKLTS